MGSATVSDMARKKKASSDSPHPFDSSDTPDPHEGEGEGVDEHANTDEYDVPDGEGAVAAIEGEEVQVQELAEPEPEPEPWMPPSEADVAATSALIAELQARVSDLQNAIDRETNRAGTAEAEADVLRGALSNSTQMHERHVGELQSAADNMLGPLQTQVSSLQNEQTLHQVARTAAEQRALNAEAAVDSLRDKKVFQIIPKYSPGQAQNTRMYVFASHAAEAIDVAVNRGGLAHEDVSNIVVVHDKVLF